MKDPYRIWEMLKSDTTYVHDPVDIELLQSMQTMLSKNNYHGIFGAGDCDCFTIAAAACFVVAGLPSCIILAGNGQQPTHIYNLVYIARYNSWLPFDLTENIIGSERKYKNKTEIKIIFGQSKK